MRATRFGSVATPLMDASPQFRKESVPLSGGGGDNASDSSVEREEREKEKQRIMESLVKYRPFQKNYEATLDGKLAAGELGVKILERVCNGEFLLAGEDNFLLG